MLSKAILHRLELLNAINTLRVLLRVHKARERLAELHTANTMRHASKTGTVPVDLAGDRVERPARAAFVLFPFRSLYPLYALDSLW